MTGLAEPHATRRICHRNGRETSISGWPGVAWPGLGSSQFLKSQLPSTIVNGTSKLSASLLPKQRKKCFKKAITPIPPGAGSDNIWMRFPPPSTKASGWPAKLFTQKATLHPCTSVDSPENQLVRPTFSPPGSSPAGASHNPDTSAAEQRSPDRVLQTGTLGTVSVCSQPEPDVTPFWTS